MNSIFRIGGGSFRIPNLVSGITTKFNSEFDYSQVPQISQITEILVFMYLYSPYLHSYHHYFPLAYLHKAAPVLWILYLFKVYQAQSIFVEFVTNNCYYNVASKKYFQFMCSNKSTKLYNQLVTFLFLFFPGSVMLLSLELNIPNTHVIALNVESTLFNRQKYIILVN